MSAREEPGTNSSSGLLRSQTFLTRFRTAAVLGISVLLAIHCTLQWPLFLIVAGIGIQSCIELKEMLGRPHIAVSCAAFFALMGLAFYLKAQQLVPLPYTSIAYLLIGVGSLLRRIKVNKPSWLDNLAVFWLAAPFSAAVWLHGASLDYTRLFSPNVVLILLMPLWLGDTAAYLVGKKYGKHKLAPKISPKKTWEGSLANLATAIAISTLIGSFFAVPIYDSVLVGAIIGIFGQLGDLLQSALKRRVNLKDSGGILPGHGGFLDRIDSLLTSAPLAATALWIVAPWLFHVKH